MRRPKASDIPDAVALAACEWIGTDRPPPYLTLMALGFPEKVVYAKLEKLDRRGFLEVGVSLRCGWLNQRGKDALLAAATADLVPALPEEARSA